MCRGLGMVNPRFHGDRLGASERLFPISNTKEPRKVIDNISKVMISNLEKNKFQVRNLLALKPPLRSYVGVYWYDLSIQTQTRRFSHQP